MTMHLESTPHRFGLLPEPERNPTTFFASAVLNVSLLGLLLILGTFTHHVVIQRRMELTTLELPVSKPPEIKVKTPPPPRIPPPPRPEVVHLEPPHLAITRPEPKPEAKPIQMMKETAQMPVVHEAKPQIVLAPQPKAALAYAAAPAVAPQAHPSTTAVHFGDLNGVRPNPNANRPATVAAGQRSASRRVKTSGMCCTISTGTGKLRGSCGKRTSRAAGPPVETPMASIETFDGGASVGGGAVCPGGRGSTGRAAAREDARGSTIPVRA